MAAASAAGGSAAGLRLGDAFSRAAALWGRIAGPFIGLYVLGMIPTALNTLAARPQHGAGVAGLGWSFAAATLLAGLIGLVTHAAVIDATSRTMDGAPPAFVASIGVAMGRFWPVLGAAIVGGLMIGFGFILLFVPGLMAYTALYVSTPVCVLERLGPVASLRRSAELTRGSRWRLFGLVLVLLLLGVITAGSSYAGRLMFGPVGGVLLQIAVSAVIGLFETILVAVVYRDLVAGRDGFGGDRMAAVFG